MAQSGEWWNGEPVSQQRQETGRKGKENDGGMERGESRGMDAIINCKCLKHVNRGKGGVLSRMLVFEVGSPRDR